MLHTPQHHINARNQLFNKMISN